MQNVDVALTALKVYDTAGLAGQGQKMAAAAAYAPVADKNGNISIFSMIKGATAGKIGQMTLDDRTKEMRSIIGRVSAGDIKDKFGSVLTPSEMSTAAAYIPTADKATVDPKAAIEDLLNYKKILQIKAKTMSSGEAAAALTAPRTNAPAAKAAPVDGEVRYSGATPYRFNATSKQWIPAGS